MPSKFKKYIGSYLIVQMEENHLSLSSIVHCFSLGFDYIMRKIDDN